MSGAADRAALFARCRAAAAAAAAAAAGPAGPAAAPPAAGPAGPAAPPAAVPASVLGEWAALPPVLRAAVARTCGVLAVYDGIEARSLGARSRDGGTGRSRMCFRPESLGATLGGAGDVGHA